MYKNELIRLAHRANQLDNEGRYAEADEITHYLIRVAQNDNMSQYTSQSIEQCSPGCSKTDPITGAVAPAGKEYTARGYLQSIAHGSQWSTNQQNQQRQQQQQRRQQQIQQEYSTTQPGAQGNTSQGNLWDKNTNSWVSNSQAGAAGYKFPTTPAPVGSVAPAAQPAQQSQGPTIKQWLSKSAPGTTKQQYIQHLQTWLQHHNNDRNALYQHLQSEGPHIANLSMSLV